jgi:hypothetical protein
MGVLSDKQIMVASVIALVVAVALLAWSLGGSAACRRVLNDLTSTQRSEAAVFLETHACQGATK